MTASGRDKSPEERVAESRRLIAEAVERAKTAPARPLPRNPHWHDSPAYRMSGIALPVRPGFSWLVTVDGERAEGTVVGRRSVADGGTPAMLVRVRDALLALRNLNDPGGWGTDPYTAYATTTTVDLPVLAWRVPADVEPVPAPTTPLTGVLVRPVPIPDRDRGGDS